MLKNGTRNDDGQVFEAFIHDCCARWHEMYFEGVAICSDDTKHLHEKIFGDSSESRRNQKNVMKKVGLEFQIYKRFKNI